MPKMLLEDLMGAALRLYDSVPEWTSPDYAEISIAVAIPRSGLFAS